MLQMVQKRFVQNDGSDNYELAYVVRYTEVFTYPTPSLYFEVRQVLINAAKFQRSDFHIHLRQSYLLRKHTNIMGRRLQSMAVPMLRFMKKIRGDKKLLSLECLNNGSLHFRNGNLPSRFFGKQEVEKRERKKRKKKRETRKKKEHWKISRTSEL